MSVSTTGTNSIGERDSELKADEDEDDGEDEEDDEEEGDNDTTPLLPPCWSCSMRRKRFRRMVRWAWSKSVRRGPPRPQSPYSNVRSSSARDWVQSPSLCKREAERARGKEEGFIQNHTVHPVEGSRDTNRASFRLRVRVPSTPPPLYSG